jgi:hypothetical protein
MVRYGREDIFCRNLSHAGDIIGTAGFPMEVPCWAVVASQTIDLSGDSSPPGVRVQPQFRGDGSEQAHSGYTEDAGDVERTGIDTNQDARVFEKRRNLDYLELVSPIDCIWNGCGWPYPTHAVEIGADLDHDCRRARRNDLGQLTPSLRCPFPNGPAGAWVQYDNRPLPRVHLV